MLLILIQIISQLDKDMPNPAEQLLGKTTEDGWLVTKKQNKLDGQSGGNFSVGYYAEKNGTTAFLKALDINRFLSPQSGSNRLEQIKLGTDSFLYERQILQHCADNGLSKIIRIHTSGEFDVNKFPVPYLIFELANSDVRKETIINDGLDLVWALKTIHSISVGLKQLHYHAISHQDLKPSNILVLDNGERKIGDFGRSVTKECTLPHSNYFIAGDPAYAPPEGLYGFRHPDWNYRRLGCDCYQLGSIVVFLLTGLSMTATLQELLPEEFQANAWRGTYEEVLPYLEHTYGDALKVIKQNIDSSLDTAIIELVKELCHPDVKKRGNPKFISVNRNPFGMERYVSKFNKLSKLAEYNLGKAI